MIFEHQVVFEVLVVIVIFTVMIFEYRVVFEVIVVVVVIVVIVRVLL